MEGVRTLSVLLALEQHNCKMEAAMDTDEAREVSLEPEGSAVDTQKKLCVFEKCNTLSIRWGYTL